MTKKILTLKQRADRAEKWANRFSLLFPFVIAAACICGAGALVYFNWLLAGVCCLCIPCGVGLKGAEAHFRDKAAVLEAECFQEVIRSTYCVRHRDVEKEFE